MSGPWRSCLMSLVLLVMAVPPAGSSVVGLEPGAPGYVHEAFGVEDGLPAAGILEVLQARTGYLWLATFDGLVRFDGSRFEIFDGERVPSLGSNRIVDLVEERDGTLWILSQQGHLARLVDGVFTACGDASGGRVDCDLVEPGPVLYESLYEDPEGGVWVGGRRGLYRIERGALRRVAGFDGSGRVRTILLDRRDRLWVGTEHGLWHGAPGAFEPIDLGERAEPAVDSLAQGPDGSIWVGLEAEAVGRVRSGRFEPWIEEPGHVVAGPRGEIWAGFIGRLVRHREGGAEVVVREGRGFYILKGSRNLAIDARGNLWIAWAQTLRLGDHRVFHLDQRNVSLSSVTVDNTGTVWVTGTGSGELHAFHPARVETVIDGLPSPTVYPVYEDRDGTLWVGDDYLAKLAPGGDRFQRVASPAVPPRRVRSILRDRTGRLWIGTGRGLFSRSGESYEGPYGPAPLQTAQIVALTEGAGGVLWVGTEKGLFRIGVSGHWTRFGGDDGLLLPKIQVIREMPDGTVWLGTDGAGLVRVRDGELTVVDRSDGLSSDLVRAIWPASDGRLWIATENHGLNRLDPATVDEPGGPEIDGVGRSQGLFSSGVHQIVPDGLGNLWMSSNRGIFRARLEDLEAVADGREEQLECVVYTERDGMLDQEGNGGMQQAGLRDREGRIWFPTQAGLVRIEPETALRAVPPPPIHVEHLRVEDRVQLPEDGAVQLPPWERTFSVTYAAPSFRAPERLRFRYRLTPFDDDWIDARSRHEAFYTRLPPGAYRFEVAVASEGVWSEPAVMELVLAPRFFETGWFLGLCFAAVGGLVVGVVRLRESRQRARRLALEQLVKERTATIAEQAEALRRMDERKSRFVANISHEFRTPLTLTLGPLQDALDGAFGSIQEPLAEQLRLAVRNGRRLLRLVEQLLDLARLEGGGLVLAPRRSDLAAQLRLRLEAFQGLAQRRGVELVGRIPDGPVEIVCDPAEMEKVFDNLLSNALKLTPEGGSVVLELDAPEGSDRVTLTVQDDGPGIPAGQVERVFERFHQVEAHATSRSGTGLGLALAREIVDLHGGAISVVSTEGEGACFEVRLWREPDELRGRVQDGPEPTDEGLDPLSAAPPLDDGGPAAGTGKEATGDRAAVLVAEDDADLRAYLRRHLEPTYRVIEADDGETAIELAHRELPDLVVSDVMMPGLDGKELVRRLREDPELELVPVILVTAKGGPANRLEGLREGAADYLVKPFDPRELTARVENLIGARRRLVERIGAPRGLEISAIDATPADQDFLRRVQEAVEARLGDVELTVESLAAEVNCDRSHLLRRLRTLIDETPSGLIRSLRLQRAAQLLRARAGTVGEVAYAVGFKSVAHFSNSFLGRYGERPSAYAARHHSERGRAPGASPSSCDREDVP